MNLYFIQLVFFQRLVCTSPGLGVEKPRCTRCHPHLLGLLFWRADSWKCDKSYSPSKEKIHTYTKDTGLTYNFKRVTHFKPIQEHLQKATLA